MWSEEGRSQAKRERRLQEDRRAADRRNAKLWKSFFGFAAVTVVMLILPRFFDGPDGDALDAPPDALNGRWVTDDARYADRFMTIEPDGMLSLGLGEGAASFHRIRSIHGVRSDDHWEYVISYASPEGEQLMTVFLHDDGILRLRNPSSVQWRKAEG